MRPGWEGSVAPGGWRGVAACLLSSRLSAASGRRRCAPLVQAPRGWRRAHATPVYNTGTDGVRTHRHREVFQVANVDYQQNQFRPNASGK